MPDGTAALFKALMWTQSHAPVLIDLLPSATGLKTGCEGFINACREACGKFVVRALSRVLFILRRFSIEARKWRPRVLVRSVIQAPVNAIAEVQALCYMLGFGRKHLPVYPGCLMLTLVFRS